MANMNLKNDKALRVMYIYERLCSGECLNKSRLAQELGVSEKTIQRDMSEIKNYVMEVYHNDDYMVRYNRFKDCYYMEKSPNKNLLSKFFR